MMFRFLLILLLALSGTFAEAKKTKSRKPSQTPFKISTLVSFGETETEIIIEEGVPNKIHYSQTDPNSPNKEFLSDLKESSVEFIKKKFMRLPITKASSPCSGARVSVMTIPSDKKERSACLNVDKKVGAAYSDFANLLQLASELAR